VSHKPVLVLTLLFISIFLSPLAMNAENEEDYDWLFQLIDEDPSSAYNFAWTISNITLDYDTVGYSYRVAGSYGSEKVASYIADLLTQWGLNVTIHSFDFINWNIDERPIIRIKINNETFEETIYPAHYSYGTPVEGLNSTIEILPLPENFTYDPLPSDIKAIWDATNISNKIVLIGREVRFNHYWFAEFYKKLSDERPIAILYTWATKDFEKYPFFFSSTGGRNLEIFRELKIPIAWIPKNLTKKIVEARTNGYEINATIRVPIIERKGKVKNIIGTIEGRNKNLTILITAHYDSVMTGGLADNAAGTAGCLELAWAFMQALREGIYQPPVNLTFVFFTAEEAGLIGSLKFYEAYLDYLETSVIGVINLDTLGSYILEVSRSNYELRFLGKSYYIHDFVVAAAHELGLEISIFSDEIHSDDSTFENPLAVISLVKNWWPDLEISITRVINIPAAMIGSWPYLPWQGDYKGRVGWIHTPYDNATSTEVYDWVNPSRLETQIKVAGLALLNILKLYTPPEEQRIPQPIPPLLLIAIIPGIGLVIIIMYGLRRRIKGLEKS